MTDKPTITVFPDEGNGTNSIRVNSNGHVVTQTADVSCEYSRILYEAIERIAELESSPDVPARAVTARGAKLYISEGYPETLDAAGYEAMEWQRVGMSGPSSTAFDDQFKGESE